MKEKVSCKSQFQILNIFFFKKWETIQLQNISNLNAPKSREETNLFNYLVAYNRYRVAHICGLIKIQYGNCYLRAIYGFLIQVSTKKAFQFFKVKVLYENYLWDSVLKILTSLIIFWIS